MLKYKLTFYSDSMFFEAGAYTSHPSPCFYLDCSHPFKKQFKDQLNTGPLCAYTYTEMIDSALCKIDSLRVSVIDGFRTKPEDVYSVDVYPTVTRFYDGLTFLQNNKVDFGFTNC